MGCLHLIPLLRAQGTPQKGTQKEFKSQRGQRAQENKVLQSRAHRDWSSKHRASTGPHQVLCTRYSFSLIFLWDSCMCEQMGLWFLCLLLGFFSFCWCALSNFNVMVFILSYCILLCLLSLRSLFQREKRSRSGWRRWGGTWENRGRVNCNQDIEYKKKKPL